MSNEFIKDYYYESGIIKSESHYLNDKLHDDKGAAFIQYDRDGNIILKEYYLNGEMYGKIVYFSNGNIKTKSYVFEGLNHREDGPAIVEYYINGNIKSEYYYKYGKQHREDGPATIEYYNNEKNSIGSEAYLIDGRFHNESGPAVIDYTNDNKIKIISFLKNGELHREDGPAYIRYLNGEDYYEEQYYIMGLEVNMSKYLYIDEEQLINLISKSSSVVSLLKFKLIVNKFFKNNSKKKLLTLIDCKMVMLKLI